MDQSQEIIQLLTEIRDQLREGAKRQAEMLEFVRANAERAKATADRSVALQEVAVKRAKSVMAVAFPLIAVIVAVLAWLIFGVARRW